MAGTAPPAKLLPSRSSAETAKNPLLLKRFEQEFKAASLIDHPNVVKAMDYCGTGATPFLVMEFVDGESLGARIERDGPIDEAEAIRIIGQVCEGLHRAHKQGLIHRDVKPDNILLTQDGTAKLTDLGLVKDVEGEMNLTKTGRGLGTPHFMAPEQFRNAKNADVRCDVYSLGATFYMMVTAVIPFDKTSPLDCWLKKTKNDFVAPKKANPKLSDRTDWAIKRAMHNDPAQRQTSCREFMEDLMGTGWRTSTSNSGTHLPLGAVNTEPPPAPAEDIWYMVYRDAKQQMHTVKGATESIRRNITAGTLGDLNSILVSRTKTGTFLPLRSTPEFRDIALINKAMSEPTVSLPSLADSAKILAETRRDTVTASKTPTNYDNNRPGSTTSSPGLSKVSDIRPSPLPETDTAEVVVKPVSKDDARKLLQKSPFIDRQATKTRPAWQEWLPFVLLGFVLAVLLMAAAYIFLK
jgi:eukaryotic-like serine/threonine-protein kinase